MIIYKPLYISVILIKYILYHRKPHTMKTNYQRRQGNHTHTHTHREFFREKNMHISGSVP